MMIASVLQRQGALLLGGRALSTSIAALAKREAADDFIFQEKCRGTRKVSQDSEDLRERLRKTDFGAPRRTKAAAASAPSPGQDGAADASPTTQQQQQQQQPGRSLQPAPAEAVEQRSADDAAQELVEKGSKRMMQSDEGREELAQGSFDLDKTTDRVAKEGAKEASPGAAARADDPDVKKAVKSRVVAGSQAS